MDLKKKYKNNVWLFSSLFLITAIVFFMGAFYVRTLKASMEKETAAYLSEVSRHVSEMINFKWDFL